MPNAFKSNAVSNSVGRYLLPRSRNLRPDKVEMYRAAFPEFQIKMIQKSIDFGVYIKWIQIDMPDKSFRSL